MRITAKDGHRGVLVDLDTGRRIPHARWYDTETGEYETVQRGLDGVPVFTRGRGRLKFIQGAILYHRAAATGEAPIPAGSPSLARGQRTGRGRRLPGWLLEHDCEAYACIRKAQWVTADEIQLPPGEKTVVIPPIIAGNGSILVPAKTVVRRYQRGKVLRRHYWCHQHYTCPGIQHPDGSIDPQEVQAGRPQ